MAESEPLSPYDPSSPLEIAACTPQPLDPSGFNAAAQLPYELTIDHVRAAMEDFLSFLSLIDHRLNQNSLPRLECLLMQANFSSLVGEFVGARIPRHCSGLVRNAYHNGYPDLIPPGRFPNNSIQHAANAGIEIKGSRYQRGWQGHNAEDGWLMVLVYDSDRPVDVGVLPAPRPFTFTSVYAAQLTMADWTFSGRSETSRRTITASVNTSGYARMTANQVYHAPRLSQ